MAQAETQTEHLRGQLKDATTQQGRGGQDLPLRRSGEIDPKTLKYLRERGAAGSIRPHGVQKSKARDAGPSGLRGRLRHPLARRKTGTSRRGGIKAGRAAATAAKTGMKVAFRAGLFLVSLGPVGWVVLIVGGFFAFIILFFPIIFGGGMTYMCISPGFVPYWSRTIFQAAGVFFKEVNDILDICSQIRG